MAKRDKYFHTDINIFFYITIALKNFNLHSTLLLYNR